MMPSQKGYRSPSSDSSHDSSVVRIPAGGRRGTSPPSSLQPTLTDKPAVEQSTGTRDSKVRQVKTPVVVHNDKGKNEEAAMSKFCDGKKWR
jgi:hypothetical protein